MILNVMFDFIWPTLAFNFMFDVFNRRKYKMLIIKLDNY